MTADTLHRKLERLIGHRFDYLGEVWILVEVLGDIDSIVLQRCKDCAPYNVQQNAFGMPNRRAQDTLTLAVSDKTEDTYSQDILVLLEGHHSN